MSSQNLFPIVELILSERSESSPEANLSIGRFASRTNPPQAEKDLIRRPFDLPIGRLRVSGLEILAHLINNPFEGNCCIMLLVTIELGNPLGDTSTEIARLA